MVFSLNMLLQVQFILSSNLICSKCNYFSLKPLFFFSFQKVSRMVGAFASRQCGPGSILAESNLWVEFAVGSRSAGFSPSTPVFFPPEKPKFPKSKSNSTENPHETILKIIRARKLLSSSVRRLCLLCPLLLFQAF